MYVKQFFTRNHFISTTAIKMVNMNISAKKIDFVACRIIKLGTKFIINLLNGLT